MAITLNSNEIFAALSNMIISQQVFTDNIQNNQTLVDKAKVDGTLYGDTKLYYSTDVLASSPWGNDAEAANLLAIHRPQAPKVQAIALDVFRQIALTVDNYLSKRAWSTEGAFSAFNSTMKGWMNDTKKVYDGTLYNVYIGTTETTIGEQTPTALTLTAGKEAQEIAEYLANLFVRMGDYSRDFTDFGQLRSYKNGNIKVIWNASYVNKIKKIDLPTIFHKDGLVDKFEEEILPTRYFGRDVDSSDDVGSGKIIDASGIYDPTKGTIRSRIEIDLNSVAMDHISYDPKKHLFPGDEIPSGSKLAASAGLGIDFIYDEVYIEKPKVICKVLVKLPPYMSAFEAATSFFNAKSLTENNYLTFGHNTLQYLKNYPFITICEA